MPPWRKKNHASEEFKYLGEMPAQVDPQSLSHEDVKTLFLLCKNSDEIRKRRSTEEFEIFMPEAVYLLGPEYTLARAGIMELLYNRWSLRMKPRRWNTVFSERWPNEYAEFQTLPGYSVTTLDKVNAACDFLGLAAHLSFRRWDKKGYVVIAHLGVDGRRAEALWLDAEKFHAGSVEDIAEVIRSQKRLTPLFDMLQGKTSSDG